MKLYDIKCPICGTVNRKLVLEETDGWMECEHCRIVVKVLPYDGDRKVPVYSPQQLAARFAVAN